MTCKSSHLQSVGTVAAALILFAAVCFVFLQASAEAENRVEEWSTTFTWHSDTNASGDEIVYADEYHWDTLSMLGFARSDGVATKTVGFGNVWKYDGFKVYLKIPAVTAGCSIRVGFRIGTSDSVRLTTCGSTAVESEGELEQIYSFFPHYDNDSIDFMEGLWFDIIVGDTITNDTAEFNRTVSVTARLFGKD